MNNATSIKYHKKRQGENQFTTGQTPLKRQDRLEIELERTGELQEESFHRKGESQPETFTLIRLRTQNKNASKKSKI